MSNNSSCILYPDAPNGEESRLYKKLLNLNSATLL